MRRLIRSEKERLEVRRNFRSRKTIRSETTTRREKKCLGVRRIIYEFETRRMRDVKTKMQPIRMEMFPFGHCPEGNGGSGNSRGKRLAISMVVVAWLSEKEEDRQKSYADLKRKPMEFEVGDRVMLKVSPWKGVVRFGKRGKLNPRYVGPFKVLAKVGKVAYRLELPQELSRVHHTFHVSNLKKCYADEPLVMPLEGIHVDDKLQFVEEPVEIMEREIKRLKRSRIPLVKVRWNSRRGPEFTWEREDSFKQKYPQLFTNRASSSTTRS
ncbi:hypothetical protein Tco_0352354 [Tanacetum coccineum]